MAEFENFIKAELPLRVVALRNEPEETLLIRKGPGPRVYEALDIQEGQILTKVNGVLTSVNITDLNTASILRINSGEALGAQRVVVGIGNSAYYSVPTNAAHTGRVIGITTTATSINTPALVQTSGVMEDSTWTFNNGVVYNGSNGVLTQTAPLSGFVLPIGVAVSPTKILINIKLSVTRI